jgi:hypothetical protein
VPLDAIFEIEDKLKCSISVLSRQTIPVMRLMGRIYDCSSCITGSSYDDTYFLILDEENTTTAA